MKLITLVLIVVLSGCATLTEDPMTPIVVTFAGADKGYCRFQNKRGNWDSKIPGTVTVRKSDDELKYTCETSNGLEAHGGIPSRMGGKIIASAVFIDFGITDAITDKHREYPANFVIPVIEPETETET